MYIKEFDQLSFEYRSLKSFLLNSCILSMNRMEFIGLNGGLGETVYICNKSAVSGRLEAFVAMYYRYMHDAEEWTLELAGENLSYVLDRHIVPSLRAFNFDFQSYEYTLNLISKNINGLKENCLNQNRKIKVFETNAVSEDNELCISLLNEINIPTSFSILRNDFGSKLYLFETMEKFVLLDIWFSD